MTLHRWFLLFALTACAAKDPVCMDGYARDDDGRCVPISSSSIDGVSIGPLEVRTLDSLVATVVFGGETVDASLPVDVGPVRYRWFVDGTEVEGTANHLDGWMYFEKSQAVSLLVEPLDGELGVWSNTVTIQNTPPPAPSVEVYPEMPLVGVDGLRCTIGGVGDFDGDEISYSVSWTRNGTPWAAIPPPMDDGGDPPDWDTGDLPPDPPPDPSEVPASVPQSGELWTCHASAFDGEAFSPEQTAFVRIPAEFAGWETSSVNLEDSDYIFVGEHDNDAAGASLSLVGDVDADGLGDFAIPAYFNDEGAEDAGKVYLVRGVDLSDGPGT